MIDSRIEKDCLGEMEIPNDLYYGIQTMRMIKASGAGGFPVIFYPGLHRALFQIKKACARANADIGALDAESARAIAQAADMALAGRFDDQFPLDVWQGGGYTCVNMNVNEVLGNAANEILTGRKGQDRVHPNTHVNKGQSTNDVIPSASHLAAAGEVDRISSGLRRLEETFKRKAEEFKSVVKVGRTCWQDALPVTLGQEFSGYAAVVGRTVGRFEAFRPRCFELVMGGSAVGTGFGTEPGYMDALYRHLSEQYGEQVKPAENLFDGFQNADFFVSLSGLAKEAACVLSKISKDLRMMSSGPRAGFMEISLPAVCPGSSIMPGKINPTVPEMVVQIAHQVIGNDVAVSLACEEGELDLNVWDASLYKCLFESLRIVGGEIEIFRRECVEGIEADEKRCREEAEGSIALCTAAAAAIDYPSGVAAAKYCAEQGVNAARAVVDLGMMTKEEAEVMMDPMLTTSTDEMARALRRFKRMRAAEK